MVRTLGMSAAVAVLLGTAPGLADERVPFTLDVEDATGKVGEPTAVRAVITPPEGIRLTSVYRHRIIDLSTEKGGGVEFDRPVVVGSLQDDGSLLFVVEVTPTEPGEHPINGLMRVSFLNDSKTESKSIPLVAKVVATE